jgi:hypothetical protein
MSNAVCGPTKPGTRPPTGNQKLADLNPCPLNACCDVWGQCGIDQNFCIDKRGPANNPGTAPAGQNGCVSHCGVDIVNNNASPLNVQRIGYYETWNWDRPCVHLRAANIDTEIYTHVHWAFATITPDFNVAINDTWKQWDDFKSLPDIKKIVSFGGWGYSTDPATYEVLRQAMNPTNRNTFATNVVKFLNANKLDGVDFDWEYPGVCLLPPESPRPPVRICNANSSRLPIFRVSLPASQVTARIISSSSPCSRDCCRRGSHSRSLLRPRFGI